MRPAHRRRLLAVAAVIGALCLGVANGFPGWFVATDIIPVAPWSIVPFVLLLTAIAVAPFIDRHWWEKNYPAVAFLLGFVVVTYYVLGIHNTGRMMHTAREYVSFISLIGSLFVVAGGIHIEVRGRATPIENLGFLTIGAVLANILGTTGASMVLIRPYIRMNRNRIRPFHIVFFIFVVSNIGGALTPIGDPPLFLGYLKGVPFFWVATKASVIWAVTLLAVLSVFWVLDTRSLRSFAGEWTDAPEKARITGLHNLFFLAVILGAVFIEHPPMVREVVMWSAALGSLFTTPREIYDQNDFSFGPVKEVAILFAGIFATMVPALDWLSLNARAIGIETVGQFYWATGVLSSVLDNAPTYLNFLSASFGLNGLTVDDPTHMTMMLSNAAGPGSASYVVAISVAAVFFGACTYIGNGPNFMVKSIAEGAKVHVPGFGAYIARYAVPILVPIYALVWALFFMS